MDSSIIRGTPETGVLTKAMSGSRETDRCASKRKRRKGWPGGTESRTAKSAGFKPRHCRRSERKGSRSKSEMGGLGRLARNWPENQRTVCESMPGAVNQNCQRHCKPTSSGYPHEIPEPTRINAAGEDGLPNPGKEPPGRNWTERVQPWLPAPRKETLDNVPCVW